MQNDADLILLARAGDRDALGAVYDRYGDRLYDLCSSVLRDDDLAFDAMVDTFVLASLEMYRLRRPDRLQAWLFAIAREQLLARRIPVGVDEHAESDGEAAVAESVGAGAIVWEAVSWLPPRDRILIDLYARQRFDDRTLARVIGVSLPHAVALTRDLEERVERLMTALLVARLSRPGCPALQRLIVGEDQYHPDAWLRHVALHVDVCRTCLLWRENQPSAIQLIKDVPAEAAPRELRDEIIDRVDLLWAELGPPDWTASIASGEQPTEVFTEVAPEPEVPATEVVAPEGVVPELPAVPGADANTGDATGATAETEPAAPEPAGADVPAAADMGLDPDDPVVEYPPLDEVDDVESLLPPPPRMRRNGFPRRSMYPRRRRGVVLGTVVLGGLLAAAIVLNFRGFGSRSDRLYTAEARAANPAAATTAPPTSAPPTPTTAPPGPDTRGPFVFQLATVHGCIGPSQPNTTALATVADDRGRVDSVELVFVDANGTETRRPMTRRAGNEFEGTIGPFAAEGNIMWTVIGMDPAGNSTTGIGQPVGSSSSC